MITVKTKVFFNRAAHGRKTIDTKPAASVAVDPGRVPRISRLMALAIHFDEMIRAGKVANISEIARLANATDDSSRSPGDLEDATGRLENAPDGLEHATGHPSRHPGRLSRSPGESENAPARPERLPSEPEGTRRVA